MQDSAIYKAGLYLRLSKDDEQQGESISIGTQRAILTDYCTAHGYKIQKVYVDDGYSGLNFDRPGFQELLDDVERGVINMVITKDLSRLGRDYIMTGYYSEIFFQSKGVRYVAVTDNVDSLNGNNDFAPFRNILNDMYARDISQKIRHAKRQRAKQGLFISGQAPYGYQKDPHNRNRLIIDPEAAVVVRTIFSLARDGLGSVAIASELKARRIVAPSVYKYQRGDDRFARYPAINSDDHCNWCPTTITQILKNRVYTGTLVNLKTETVNYKTKQRTPVPLDQQIIIPDAHKPIISEELFQEVQLVRELHRCPAKMQRFNLFRDLLYCECCGHPLSISRKQLKYREADIYLCMYHYSHPAICPRTHRIYHEMLYPYVLQQIRIFAKSMKRRKVNSSIKEYTMIQELTQEILDDVIERIEIGHVTKKSKPGNVIQIYWKLK